MSSIGGATESKGSVFGASQERFDSLREANSTNFMETPGSLNLSIDVEADASKSVPQNMPRTPANLFNSAAVERLQKRFPSGSFSFFTWDSFKIDHHEIILLQQLAKGSYGTVYKAKYQGNTVAVKMEEFPSNTEAQVNVLTELTVLQTFSHPRMVKYLGTSYMPTPTGSKVAILMEICRLGALREALPLALSWSLKVRIAADVAEGLAYLHSKDIIHRDIKTTNVLITDDWRAVLCDYSFCTHKDSEHKQDFVYGTDEFMAPEMASGRNYDCSADLFSFGILLAELVTEREPNDHFLLRKPRDEFAIDQNEICDATPPDCPQSLLSLILNCCEQEPDARNTAEYVREWLGSILEELLSSEGLTEVTVPSAPDGHNHPLPPSPRREGNVIQPRPGTSSIRTAITPYSYGHQSTDIHSRLLHLEMYVTELKTENMRMESEIQNLRELLGAPELYPVSNRAALSRAVSTLADFEHPGDGIYDNALNQSLSNFDDLAVRVARLEGRVARSYINCSPDSTSPVNFPDKSARLSGRPTSRTDSPPAGQNADFSSQSDPESAESLRALRAELVHLVDKIIASAVKPSAHSVPTSAKEGMKVELEHLCRRLRDADPPPLALSSANPNRYPNPNLNPRRFNSAVTFSSPSDRRLSSNSNRDPNSNPNPRPHMQTQRDLEPCRMLRSAQSLPSPQETSQTFSPIRLLEDPNLINLNPNPSPHRRTRSLPSFEPSNPSQWSGSHTNTHTQASATSRRRSLAHTHADIPTHTHTDIYIANADLSESVSGLIARAHKALEETYTRTNES